ncbi:MAG: RagB/SusD family nutrient uptake outer membrane protein [Candidatus Symbiothrix sp.]|jgi:hypothetical protein|nr:RagB/SusD family nutrient uptake outer membrane protein [Candidatus Symbiothrix sp.]
MKTINKLLIVLLGFSLFSCSEDFFDIENTSVVTADELNSSPEKLLSVVEPLQVGIYSYMTQYNTQGSSSTRHEDFGWMGIAHLGDVMNDDLAFHTRGSGWFTYDYELDYWGAQYVRPFFYWNFCYTVVAKANDIISKIALDTENPELRAILGQSFALRALGHFYAAQMYQQTYIGNEDAKGVPVIITSGEGESDASRGTLKSVYAQIRSDFEKSIDYLDGWERPSKVYINKNVAAGLYSRALLVLNDWDNAAKYAHIAREGFPVLTISELATEGFNNINSKEWLWGADITGETTTMFASFFSFVCSYDAGYGGQVGQYRKIDAKLYSQMSVSDARRKQFKVAASGNNYTSYEAALPDYTNLKFKAVPNWEADYVFMRTSELVLTEAEALARSGKGSEAANVLKELMQNRDPSWSASTVTGEDVYQQRRIELWAEGFSLFDHLRLKKGIDRAYAGSNHLSSAKYKIPAGSWYFLFQLPLRELDNNSAMSKDDQNPAPTESKFQ